MARDYAMRIMGLGLINGATVVLSPAWRGIGVRPLAPVHRGGFLPEISRKIRIPVLLALVFVAGWLRFTAIGFGLPERFRPDEVFLAPKALEKDWNPRSTALFYPAAQIHLLHVVLRSYATVTGSGTNLPEVYATDHQALAFWIARAVSAAMGAATMPAAYWAAEPAFGPTAALASAAIVAFSPVHVRKSIRRGALS